MSTRSRTWIALTAGAVFGFSAALTGNALADRSGAEAGTAVSSDLPWEDARMLAEVLQRIRTEYVDKVDDHRLMMNAVRGMVSALDPHSTFLDSNQYEEMRVSTMGSYPGIGIEVVADGAFVKIQRPIEGSPAEAAGLRPGDLIEKIDGNAVGSDVPGAIARMRGHAGTPVTLTIRRAEEPGLLTYTLKRAQVAVHSVSRATLEPGLGYVRISNFTETTADDLDRALGELKRDNGGHLKGLVLDLRNNPGGVLEAGVAVADAFIDEGLIVSADGRTAEAKFRMDATAGDLTGGAPIVVLVNGGSASASEIVAGALKDHHRATLVGRKTYGKGSVQTVMPLSHGGAIKLTTSRYFTPSGVSIHEKGIIPDVVTSGPEGAPIDLRNVKNGPIADRDAELAKAVDALKARMAPPQTVASAAA